MTLALQGFESFQKKSSHILTLLYQKAKNSLSLVRINNKLMRNAHVLHRYLEMFSSLWPFQFICITVATRGKRGKEDGNCDKNVITLIETHLQRGTSKTHLTNISAAATSVESCCFHDSIYMYLGHTKIPFTSLIAGHCTIKFHDAVRWSINILYTVLFIGFQLIQNLFTWEY